MKPKLLISKALAIAALSCISLYGSSGFKSNSITLKKMVDSKNKTSLFLHNRGDFVAKNLKVVQNGKELICEKNSLLAGNGTVCKSSKGDLQDKKPIVFKSDIFSTIDKKSLNISNSSFENSDLSNWKTAENVEIDSGSYKNQDGSFFLKITGSKNFESKASKIVKIQEGRLYELNLLAGLARNGSNLSIITVNYLDANYKLIKKDGASNVVTNLIGNGFKKYTFMLEAAPKNAKYIQIKAVSKNNTLYIDKLNLKEIALGKKVSKISKIYFLKSIKVTDNMQPLCTCDGKVGDTVWYDKDRDGYQDSDEFGISGVKVYAYKDDKLVKSAVTDASGKYQIKNLCSGCYKFKFVLPNGWKFTKYTSGFADRKSSAKSDGWTETKEVCGNSSFCNIDAGIYKEPLFTCPSGFKKFELPYDKKLYYGGITKIDISSGFRGKLNGAKKVWIKNAYTWDGYQGRKCHTNQKHEQVRVVFVDGSNKKYPTKYTDDVADGVDFADKTTADLGMVNLNSGAKKVYVAHISDNIYGSGDHSSANSVYFKGFCYKIEDFGNPKIDIEKFTNNKDADTGTGPLIPVGETVKWTYVVKNSGNVKLTDITVKDNKEGIVCSGFSLNPGESKTCVKTAKAIAGQYENTATVEAVDLSGKKVKDTDLSHYYGVKPCIDVEKSTNGEDADTGRGPVITVGDKVTWTYRVRNAGNVKLSDIKLADDKEGNIACPKTTLDVNESMLCKKEGVAKEGQYENTATVSGKGVLGKEVTESDPSHYFGEHIIPVNPSLDIEKATNGKDADVGTGPVLNIGDKVTWTYVVRNNGNVKITNIKVTDDKEGVICQGFDLEAGAKKVCTKTGAAKEGQYVNHAVVTGKAPSGQDVKDTDPSHYLGKNPNTASIGDYVWFDKNVDGIQNSGEKGIENVKVQLYKDGKYTGKETTTDKNGKYLFKDLPAGNYSVKIIKPKNYPYFTLQNQGGNDAKDSDVNPNNGMSDTISLKEGQAYRDLDAGLVCSACNKIDIEKSTNNQDADTGTGPVVAVGSKVTWKYVVKNNGNAKVSDIKVSDDKEGAISCPKTALNAGESMTCVKTGVAKAGQYENLATVEGKDPLGNKLTDKDPSHYYGGKPGIDVEKSTNGQDADSGTGPVVAVGSTVTWKYVVKNTGNVKITNVVVKDDKEGTICSIASLAPGASKTCTKTGKAKAGQYANTATATAKDATGNSVSDKDPSHYYGKKLSCLGDFVWQDRNGNGVQESGEEGIAGAKVELLDKNGNPAKDFYGHTVTAQTTGNDGKYKFCKLRDGEYIVKVTPPNGYVISPKDKGGDDAKDSDVSPTTGKSDIIKLPEGANDMSVDAGVNKPVGCLGNFIWLDKNANGIQDSGENGVKGAKVELLDSNGNPAKDGYGDLVAPQTTGDNGEYKFCKLDAGKYIVKVTPPSGYVISPKDAGVNDAKDSDIDPRTGKTAVINLPTAGNDMTWDGGLYKPACLGDTVWLDYDGNGIQDNNSKEHGIEGVVVTLMDENGNSVTDVNGNEVAPITTKADGKYQFCNLKLGKYKVKMLKDDDMYYVTYKDKGNDDSKDSDINPDTYTTDPVELQSGDNNKDLDGGYFKCGSLIGVYSVIDMGMGAYSVNSGVLDGLKVTIYDLDGNTVDELTTDKYGRFSASNLLPGKYKVVFQKPDGMQFAKDDTVYVTVRAGEENIQVENTVAPESVKKEKVTQKLHSEGKKAQSVTRAGNKAEQGAESVTKDSMSAAASIYMLAMLLSFLAIARRESK